MLLARLLTAIAVSSMTFVIPSEARATAKERSIVDRRRPDIQCTTNSECLRKGLPLLPPQKRANRFHRRAVIPTAPACGIPQTVTLSTGSYKVSISGAMGGEANQAMGGAGATINATLQVTSGPLDVDYYIGCPGLDGANGNGAGGGGGTFFYIPGSNNPAILVAGGGGGTAYSGTAFSPQGRGGSASTSTFDASTGLGGQASTSPFGGGAGAGFSQRGADGDPSQGSVGGPGSQSFNYNGDFSGGLNWDGLSNSGGLGGGGGAGLNGGGGGGGYSGGAGSPVNSNGEDLGGIGGGSYANPDLVGFGIVVTVLTATAARSSVGSLLIETV